MLNKHATESFMTEQYSPEQPTESTQPNGSADNQNGLAATPPNGEQSSDHAELAEKIKKSALERLDALKAKALAKTAQRRAALNGTPSPTEPLQNDSIPTWDFTEEPRQPKEAENVAQATLPEPITTPEESQQPSAEQQQEESESPKDISEAVITGINNAEPANKPAPASREDIAEMFKNATVAPETPEFVVNNPTRKEPSPPSSKLSNWKEFIKRREALKSAEIIQDTENQEQSAAETGLYALSPEELRSKLKEVPGFREKMSEKIAAMIEDLKEFRATLLPEERQNFFEFNSTADLMQLPHIGLTRGNRMAEVFGLELAVSETPAADSETIKKDEELFDTEAGESPTTKDESSVSAPDVVEPNKNQEIHLTHAFAKNIGEHFRKNLDDQKKFFEDAARKDAEAAAAAPTPTPDVSTPPVDVQPPAPENTTKSLGEQIKEAHEKGDQAKVQKLLEAVGQAAQDKVLAEAGISLPATPEATKQKEPGLKRFLEKLKWPQIKLSPEQKKILEAVALVVLLWSPNKALQRLDISSTQITQAMDRATAHVLRLPYQPQQAPVLEGWNAAQAISEQGNPPEVQSTPSSVDLQGIVQKIGTLETPVVPPSQDITGPAFRGPDFSAEPIPVLKGIPTGQAIAQEVGLPPAALEGVVKANVNSESRPGVVAATVGEVPKGIPTGQAIAQEVGTPQAASEGVIKANVPGTTESPQGVIAANVETKPAEKPGFITEWWNRLRKSERTAQAVDKAPSSTPQKDIPVSSTPQEVAQITTPTVGGLDYMPDQFQDAVDQQIAENTSQREKDYVYDGDEKASMAELNEFAEDGVRRVAAEKNLVVDNADINAAKNLIRCINSAQLNGGETLAFDGLPMGSHFAILTKDSNLKQVPKGTVGFMFNDNDLATFLTIAHEKTAPENIQPIINALASGEINVDTGTEELIEPVVEYVLSQNN